MKIYQRLCVSDYTLDAENGDHFEIKRGKTYLTSAEQDGIVTVFTGFWVTVPISLFTGSMRISD